MDDAIRKFMKSMGITFVMEIARSYRNTDGRANVCIEIIVLYQGNKQYDQFHCYSFKNGEVIYEEGNEVMGVDEGILHYLGDDKAVDNFFDKIARKKAQKFFEEK